MYCKSYEQIENYEEAKNDETQVWECHHRNEKFYTSNELINMGLYYDCPPCELIFLTKEQHRKEYHIGHRQSDETKKKISMANSGKTSWCKGKTRPDDYKNKISKSLKGHVVSEETRRKISESLRKRGKK